MAVPVPGDNGHHGSRYLPVRPILASKDVGVPRLVLIAYPIRLRRLVSRDCDDILAVLASRRSALGGPHAREDGVSS